MRTLLLISLFVDALYIVVFIKWKIKDLYEKKKQYWMPEWCEFCTMFWMSFFVNLFVFKLDILNTDHLIYCFFHGMCSGFLSSIIYRIYYKISTE